MTLHAILLFAQLAAPASTPVASPTLGYMFVEHQISAVTGLPGAASAAFVPGLPPIASLITASHTPAAIALPVAPEARPIFLTPYSISSLAVKGVVVGSAISPSARYALFLTSAGFYRLSLAGDLAAETLALPDPASTQLALSVSDLGAVLVTTPTELYYWSDPKAQPIHLAQALTSPRFAPNSNVIAALSSGPALILLDPATALTVQTLASERDGLTAPTAFEFGSANSIWVTQASPAALLHVRLTTHSVEPQTLSVPAIRALSTGVFLADSLHIFDTNRPTPVILLLPTVPAAK